MSDILVANGVDASRITTDTRGEKSLVTRNPRNRRVEIGLATDARLVSGETAEDIATHQAQQKLAAHVGEAANE